MARGRLPPAACPLRAAIADPGGVTVLFPSVTINLLGKLNVQASHLAVRYQSDPPALEVQGKVVLPDVFNATANFSGTNHIEISEDGWDVQGWPVHRAAIASSLSRNSVESRSVYFIA